MVKEGSHTDLGVVVVVACVLGDGLFPGLPDDEDALLDPVFEGLCEEFVEELCAE